MHCGCQACRVSHINSQIAKMELETRGLFDMQGELEQEPTLGESMKGSDEGLTLETSAFESLYGG